MQLIDSHCHLDDVRFDPDRDDVIERARLSGVEHIIVPAVKRSGWQKLADLACQYPMVVPAYGLHPWYCDEHTQDDIDILSTYLTDAKAVGECGLDFGKGRATESTQLNWFRSQLELAQALRIPVILHAYKALDTVLRELRAFPELRGVIHGFSGSQQQAEAAINQGLHLGIGGRITYPQSGRLQSIVKDMPLQHLLIETDSPDQSGFVHRGQRNEPAFLVEIVDKIATMRALDACELTGVCNQNARELFAI